MRLLKRLIALSALSASALAITQATLAGSTAAQTPAPTQAAQAASAPVRYDAAYIKAKTERGELKNIDEASFRALLSKADAGAMLDSSIMMLKERPQYKARLVKSERVRGVLQTPPDVIELKYQRYPLAVFCEWVEGPRKGRKVLYNSAVNEREMVAREGGWMGIVSVRLSLDNPMTKRDSNHNILELGLEYPLRKARQDLDKSMKAGRKIDPSEGRFILENGRRYWEIIDQSPGPPEYYAAWTRVRFDIATGMLVTIETRDKAGTLLEQIEYQNVVFTKLPASTFDEKNPAYNF